MKELTAGEFLLNNYPHVVGLHLDEEGSIETEVSLGEILNAFYEAKSKEQTNKIDKIYRIHFTGGRHVGKTKIQEYATESYKLGLRDEKRSILNIIHKEKGNHYEGDQIAFILENIIQKIKEE